MASADQVGSAAQAVPAGVGGPGGIGGAGRPRAELAVQAGPAAGKPPIVRRHVPARRRRPSGGEAR